MSPQIQSDDSGLEDYHLPCSFFVPFENMVVVALVLVAGEALTAPEPKPLCGSSDQVQCREPQESPGSGAHTYMMD